MSLPRILLWLFVINLGVAFGAGLYEDRITVPHWLSPVAGGGYRWDAEAAQADNAGLRFWVFVTTIPLTLLTLANVVAAWRSSAPMRRWWLAAALLGVADRVFTFSYFIPTMIVLMRTEAAAAPETVAKALQWTQLNHLRHAILLAAWLAALKALSFSGRRD